MSTKYLIAYSLLLHFLAHCMSPNHDNLFIYYFFFLNGYMLMNCEYQLTYMNNM